MCLVIDLTEAIRRDAFSFFNVEVWTVPVVKRFDWLLGTQQISTTTSKFVTKFPSRRGSEYTTVRSMLKNSN